MIRLTLAIWVITSSIWVGIVRADDDPISRGGCFTVAEASEIVRTHAGRVIMNMYGDANDTQYNADYRWTFIHYTVGDQFKIALFQRDLPQSMSPTKLCVWLLPITGKALFKNPAAGKPPAENILPPVDEKVARSMCPKRIEVMQAARGNRLEKLGDRWVTSDAALRAMRQVAGVSEAEEEEKDRINRQRTLKGGDARCDSLTGIIRSRKADGMKLVALFQDKNYLDNTGKRVIDSLHALFVSDTGAGRWQIYGYADGGSADIEASGDRFELEPGVFK